MALNAGIILGGQQFDLAGAMNAGRDMAMQQKAFDQQNALAELFKTQGAGIMAGDQNALAQLAQYDPQAALGIQNTRQSMAYATEDQNNQRETARREAEKYAKTISAEQAAAEAAAIEGGVKRALAAPDAATFDAMMTEMGMTDMVGQFDNRQALAADYMTVAEVLKMNAGPEAPEWRPATPEEAAANGAVAGQVNTKTGKFDAQNPPSGMVIETGPNGTTVRQGPGVGAAGDGKMKPADPALMIAAIDGILKDPALDYATGVLSPLQYIPGTPMKRFQTRSKQLEGQAFLQAFESLKGAGQITEIEGTKATQAIGRLDTAQSPEDYRQALKELREVLSLAEQRKPGWAATQGTTETTAPPGGDMSDDDLLKLYGGE